MSWEAEVAVTEVEAAGRLISDTITRDFRASSGDLLDALDSARFSSHPYSNPPKEVCTTLCNIFSVCRCLSAVMLWNKTSDLTILILSRSGRRL